MGRGSPPIPPERRLQRAWLAAWLVLWTAWCQGAPPRDARAKGNAGDLELTPEAVVASQALTDFAWGYWLQLMGEAKPDEVARHYLAALRLHPASEVVLEQLLGQWVLTRDFGRIVEALAPVAAEHPEASTLNLALAEAYAADKKLPQAIRVLQTTLDRTGWSDPGVFRQLFVYHWQAKQYAEAEALLKRARGKPALRGRYVVEQAAAVYYNALAHLPEGESPAERRKALLAEALRCARRAAGEVGNAAAFNDVQALVAVLASQEAWADAVDLLRRARETLEDCPPEVDLMLADALQKAGRAAEAAPLLEGVREQVAEHPELALDLARFYVESKEIEKAVLVYERALAAEPGFGRLRIMLGYLYLRLDKPERTLELLRPVKEPAAEKHLLQSHAYRELKTYDTAAREIALAEEAARKADSPEFFTVDFYLFYATLCEDLGYFDRTLEKANKALELAPDDPSCANFIGYVLADHNRDLDKAEDWVRKALAAEPDNVAYIDSMAWVYFRQNRLPEALGEISRCLRLGGREEDAVILDHAGDIYWANGLHLLARRFWWEALAIGVDKDADAEKIRAKMAQPVPPPPTPAS